MIHEGALQAVTPWVSQWRYLKHNLLEKGESRVRRADLKEKADFIHVLSTAATHLVCFVLNS